MKTMTVRGLDNSLVEKLKHAAKEEGKSVNQIVLETMKRRFGMDKEKRFTKVHHDLDHLFGRWSQAEFQQVHGKIDAERKIDNELWK